MNNVKIIAFYLPQYHPIPENDEWWGKGFTEWTNVSRAKPLFKNHYQPKIPADLGFYDLRLPLIREQQVELAREAGVYGFCYWHYWFGNGKQLLENIFNEVRDSGKPDFPFCLGWANHSWYSKSWNSNGSINNKLLIKQTYPGESDVILHFNYLLKAFKDKRYIKIEGKPLFLIFNPIDLPDFYINLFQKLAVRSGFSNGIHLVANISKKGEKMDELLKLGYCAVTFQRLSGVVYSNKNLIGKVQYRLINSLRKLFMNYPLFALEYRKAIPWLIDSSIDSLHNVIPTIVPNWDHTPRSGSNGSLFFNSTPELFALHAKKAIDLVVQKPEEKQIIFLKSWNEWAEGNYMEPDLKFGKKYIQALKKSLETANE